MRFALSRGLRSVLPAALLLATVRAPASTPPPPALLPPAPVETTVAMTRLGAAQMTVEATVNGQGPFRFALDTAADRSCVSARLVALLGLQVEGSEPLHSLTGTEMMPVVRIERLRVGNREVRNIVAPVLPDAALGADGLLGIDAVAEQKVVMDFARGRMSIGASSRRERSADAMIVVRARHRFGRFVLADARVNGRRIHAIVDSGIDQSIGNSALRRLLAESGPEAQARSGAIVGATGHILSTQETTLQRMRIGDLLVTNLPIAYSDAYPFRKFGVADEPAMLLGTDILRLFQQVSLDFGSKTVRLLLKDEP